MKTGNTINISHLSHKQANTHFCGSQREGPAEQKEHPHGIRFYVNSSLLVPLQNGKPIYMWVAAGRAEG